MKSERRHELQTNELADWLAKKIEVIKPYQNLILGAVLLVVVAIVVFVWWTGKSAEATAEGWDGFYATLARLRTNSPDFEGVISDLNEIIKQYPDASLGRWAALIAGDLRLASGSSQLFVDTFELAREHPDPDDQLARWAAIRAGANEELREAVDYYLAVQKDSSEPMFRERATFGLARAREAQGELDKAIQTYQELIDKWPEGTYAEEGRHRLEDLKRPSTRQLYDRLAKFEPRKSTSGFSDEPGTPGKRLEFDPEVLPDDPDFGSSPFMDWQQKPAQDKQLEKTPQTPAETRQGEPSGPEPTGPETDGPRPSKSGTNEAPPAEPGAAEPQPAEPAKPPAENNG
jgi:tetratricopeptide (TPR) repeat protein